MNGSCLGLGQRPANPGPRASQIWPADLIQLARVGML